MRGGGSDGVEDLTARSPTAHEVIPDGFSELAAPSCRYQAATGVCDTATCMCYGLETCAPLPRPPRPPPPEPWSGDRRSSRGPQVKLRDVPAGISAFPGLTPVESPGSRAVLSSDSVAIAQADVTKHARQIPIVRRNSIASDPSHWAFPCRAQANRAARYQ